MIISPHFWLRLLISFLGLWGFGYAISIARKRNREQGRTSPIVNKTERLKQWAAQAILNAGKVGLGVVLGTLLGMWIRDQQLLDNRHTYWDVAILDKYSDKSFHIQPARMQDGQWDFCAPAPFQKGNSLRYITFEQQNGCKRLEYFQIYQAQSGEKINAAIQMR